MIKLFSYLPRKPFVITAALVLATARVTSAQTITSPSGTVVVASADDYATRILQDPWDMNERTDLGWFTFGEPTLPSNLSNMSFANGIFSATPTLDDSFFWLLDTPPYPARVRFGKDGGNFPIDGNKFRTLLIRMKQTNETGSGQQYAQVLWSNNSLYNGMNASRAIQAHAGWWIYAVNLPALGVAVGTPWPGTGPSIDSLRFDPTQTTGSGQIQVDWVRLVDTSNAALWQAITWTGGGSYNIFLSDASNCANASQIATNPTSTLLNQAQPSGYQLYVGGLPAGDWHVGLGTGATPTTCSTGFFRVAGVPTMSFTSPSEEGSSDDFATMQLNNPWDFDSLGDVDFYRHITGLTTTTIQAQTEAGTSLGVINVLAGTSAPADQTTVVGDPHIYPLWSTQRGATQRIDTSRYRILTFEMSVARTRDLALGSVARVVWKVAGETSENVTSDIILRHLDPADPLANGNGPVMQKIILDLADRTKVPIEAASPSQTGWVNGSSSNPGLDNFRLDPHEFSNPTAFYIRRAKLAAFERADVSYTIDLAFTNPAGTAATVSFFDDVNATGFDGAPITGCQNLTPSASTRCVWGTSGLPVGGWHYLHAVVRVGSTVVNQAYARWPITIAHFGTPPSITAQSADQTIASGGSATFSVSAAGTPTLTYQWYRGVSGDTSSPIAGATSSGYTTAPLIGNMRCWVRVTNGVGHADSGTALATVAFTDSPLVPQATPSRVIHVTELRNRINAIRSAMGLGIFGWTYTLTAGTSVVHALDLIEMRQALQGAYDAARLTGPTYSTSPGSGAPIAAADITELRAAVVAIE